MSRNLTKGDRFMPPTRTELTNQGSAQRCQTAAALLPGVGQAASGGITLGSVIF